MIEFPHPQTENEAPHLASKDILIVGIGDAGINLIDRLGLAASNVAEIVAINTDTASLENTQATKKILLGTRAARGITIAGNSERGAEAAEESHTELARTFKNARLVILCTGLGGGTGSGATPIVAEIARSQQALVFVVCTLPFAFEGEQRSQHAQDTIRELSFTSHAMIFFENNQMAALTQPLATVQETFAVADQILAQSIFALLRVALTTGPIRITIQDLFAVFQRRSSACLFGIGAAHGSNRAQEAVTLALQSPLMNQEKLATEVTSVLVHVQGPPKITLAEVQHVMETVGTHVPQKAMLHLGVGFNGPDTDHLTVSIFCSIQDPSEQNQQSLSHRRPHLRIAAEDRFSMLSSLEIEGTNSNPSSGSDDSSAELFSLEEITSSSPKRSPKIKQETLALDPINRGRFEKSEPTIVGGEDLDVPTFLRMKIRLK